MSDDPPHGQDLSWGLGSTSGDCGTHWHWAGLNACQLLRYHNIIQPELERAGSLQEPKIFTQDEAWRPSNRGLPSLYSSSSHIP